MPRKPPRKDTYRDTLKARLIGVAEAVIAQNGLAAVQARAIAEAAECSVGTLYNVFGDIDGLILEVSHRTLQGIGEVLTAAARRSAELPLEARLMALAGAYLDFATVNRRRWRAIFDHQAAEDRVVPEGFAQDRGRLLALLDAQLAQVLPQAEARSDAAHALFASVHGIVLLALDAKLTPFDPARCERQIRFVVGKVVRGL
jgi:AcrR family transcriptional regulator